MIFPLQRIKQLKSFAQYNKDAADELKIKFTKLISSNNSIRIKAMKV